MAASKAILHSILLACCIFIFVVQGRILRLNSSDIDDQFLISDGVDHHGRDESKLSTFLGASTCNPQYGFLPCAENIPGYIFLVIVYQILLKLLDEQMDKGSKELFNIIGERKVGFAIYRFLKALPSMIFLILSGVFSSKENAQSTVSVGVGIFAGITVFSLTFQWGIILIFGNRKLNVESDDQAKDSTSSCLPGREQLIKLKDNGVMVHEWARETGGIMLLSLIPYAIVLLANIFRSSSANRIITIVALIVSVLSLASYFRYQITSTWMQESSLAYVKFDIKKERISEHIGEDDADATRRVFAKADTDQSKCLTKDEVEKLVRDLNKSGNDDVKIVVEMIMTKFDKDDDGLITEKEFVDGCINWLNDIQMLSQSQSVSSLEYLADEVVQSRKKKKRDEDTNQEECITKDEASKLLLDIIKSEKMQFEEEFAVKGIMANFDFDNGGSITKEKFLQGFKNWLNDIQKLSKIGSSLGNRAKLLKQKKRDEDPAEIRSIMSTILKQSESLRTKNRKPNVEDIKSLFNQLDRDGEKSISKSEMLEFIRERNIKFGKIHRKCNIKFGEIHRKPEEIVDIIFEKLDVNGNGTIEKLEFVNGMSSLVIEKQLPYDGWILFKSLIRVILGAAAMTVLGGPLMNNILSLSYALGLPSFCTSFVMVPITMNLAALLPSIVSAKKKGKTSASLAFSQLYSSVIMNNIVGLTSVLFIVYFKGLTWDFSAEVLTILTVCAIIGVMAYNCDSFPLWTCIVPILLYPVSLGFYGLALVFWGWN